MESSSRVNAWNPSASKTETCIASAITSSPSAINDRRFSRVALSVLVLFLVGLAALPSAAEVDAGQSQTTQLEAALARLEAREDAEHAKGAIEQARRALGTASSPGNDEAAVSRAQGIARAAITLANRQLDRRRAQIDLVDAQRRLKAIRARADAQRRALEALMRERASLARRMEAR